LKMDKIALSGLTCITRNYELSRLELDKDFKYLILNSGQAKGYYSRGNFLHDQKKSSDFHLFLIVKKSPACFQDIVIRESLILSRDLKCDIHLGPGQITFENKPTLMVRFKASDASHIDKVVETLNNKGVEFVKNKNIDDFNTIAFYKKYIEYKQIYTDIYQDNTVKSRYFIKIPGLVSFDEFCKIMKSIKNNTKFHMFEAFFAQLYYHNSMLDFAGIYSKNCQLDKFEEFKKEIEIRYKEV
ncbi:MAG: hypothetical protein JXR68_09215, partial [Bacteroidales bacterium]|nr:hypothetical protein [Bacteroidales bacterium]